jgi:hypothetical protein
MDIRRRVSFMERWVRTGKAYYVASLVAILTSAAVFLVIGGRDMAAVSVACLAAISCVPYHARRVETIRRGKEILNCHCPERNPRPLGL